MITYLNNVSCRNYNATLLHREITPVEIKNYRDWIEGAISPIDLKESSYTYSKITLVYLVEGKDEEETLINIGSLTKAHNNAILRFSDLSFKYNIGLESSSSKHIAGKYYELTIVLKSDFKIGEDQTIIIIPDKEFEDLLATCTSNVKTPAKITVTRIKGNEDMTIVINGKKIYLPSLEAGDVVVIDGENYVIKYKDEVNFEFAELLSFPVLVPGLNNEIQIYDPARSETEIKIEYTERFI